MKRTLLPFIVVLAGSGGAVHCSSEGTGPSDTPGSVADGGTTGPGGDDAGAGSDTADGDDAGTDPAGDADVPTAYHTAKDGTYEEASTWLEGAVPPAGSDVTIGHTVTLTGAASVKNVSVTAAAVFTVNAKMSITGDVQNEGKVISTNTFSFLGAEPQHVGGKGTFSTPDYVDVNAMFFDSLEFDNAAKPVAVTFNVGTTNPNVYVSRSVDFKSGAIDIGDHHLYVFADATASQTSGFLLSHKGGKGTMAKQFPPGASSFTFFVADDAATADVSPVTFTFTSNSQARWLGVHVEDGVHPAMNTGSTPTDYLSRYWVLYGEAKMGTYDMTMTFTYLPEDVVGTATNLPIGRWNGASWEQYMSSPKTANELAMAVDETTISQATCHITGRK